MAKKKIKTYWLTSGLLGIIGFIFTAIFALNINIQNSNESNVIISSSENDLVSPTISRDLDSSMTNATNATQFQGIGYANDESTYSRREQSAYDAALLDAKAEMTAYIAGEHITASETAHNQQITEKTVVLAIEGNLYEYDYEVTSRHYDDTSREAIVILSLVSTN